MRPISILLLSAPLFSFAQSTSCPPLSFNQIDNRTTLIVAYDTINGECIPANYLILEGDSTSILLDTPWNNEQTEELLAWADSSLKVPISTAIISHAHNDRMGGIDALHNRGIKTYIHSKAQEANTDFSPAKEVLTTPRGFDLGNLKINVLYPGDGHAPGNLVVLIGRHGFYGGCFLKSAYSKNLGYTGDADIRSWYCALNRLTDVAERAVWIIPGHGSADDGAFDRTLELVEEELGDELEEVECD
ncbi:MBL fold metallo-hydrolase [Phaeocystidibacter luteus]|uniref:MBL fold metallo-hydrolase n=1 Tax=Phaeocystidibacter luteus TaxID=911197 RepID=A0A6N6RIK9_9FLAO|nr:MBL fold metallo-hydrolase [Phaeocystidibacter luteus]KAB2814183.1 MBL fold metallo-hydrolase [Phaeocystidibacter luteus]